MRAYATLLIVLSFQLCAGANSLDRIARVERLCRNYWQGFGCEATDLCYHYRLDGSRGIAVMSSPEEIARREVRGKAMPYGYSSGIQDVALENGQFLMALCNAYEATRNPFFAEFAQRIFRGMKRVAVLSSVPGFVPRGPHPDGVSYYPDSSRDQHCAFIESLWVYSRSSLCSPEERAFIAKELTEVSERMERNNWTIMVEDGSHMAHVGFGWRQFSVFGTASLLSQLAAAYEVTGNKHWNELYDRFSSEADGKRWELFRTDGNTKSRPETLYSNQFFTSLRLLMQTEKDKARRDMIGQYMKVRARRALHSNLFDTAAWRRLDWAGGESDEIARKRLDLLGLRLDRPLSVCDALALFTPEQMSNPDPRVRDTANKLLYGMATVAFHETLLSEDAEGIDEIRPHIGRMVDLMIKHGNAYLAGENANRTVVLALELLAWDCVN